MSITWHEYYEIILKIQALVLQTGFCHNSTILSNETEIPKGKR